MGSCFHKFCNFKHPFFSRSQAEADPSPPFPLRRVHSDESVSVRGGDQSRGRRRNRTGRTTWYDEEEEEEEGEEEEEVVVGKEEKEDSREDLVSFLIKNV